MLHTILIIFSSMLLCLGFYSVEPEPEIYQMEDAVQDRFSVLQTVLRRWTILGSKAWNEDNLKDPCNGAGSIYLTRRGRLVFSKTGKVEQVMPNGWASRFLPSIYRGGPQYEGTVYWFLPRYLEYEDFLNRQGRILTVTNRGVDLVYFFLLQEDFLLLYVVKQEDVPLPESRTEAVVKGWIPALQLGTVLWFGLVPWLPRKVRFRFAVRILLVLLSTAMCLAFVLLQIGNEFFRVRREEHLARLAQEARQQRERWESEFAALLQKRSHELNQAIDSDLPLDKFGMEGKDYILLLKSDLTLVRYPFLKDDLGSSILESRLRQILRKSNHPEPEVRKNPYRNQDLEGFLRQDLGTTELKHMMFGLGNRHYLQWRTIRRNDGEYHYLIFLDAPRIEAKFIKELIQNETAPPQIYVDEMPIAITEEDPVPRFFLAWPKDSWFRRTDLLLSDVLICATQSLSIPGVIWWQRVPASEVIEPINQMLSYLKFTVSLGLILILLLAGTTVWRIYKKMLGLRQDFVDLMQGRSAPASPVRMGRDELSRVHATFRHFRSELARRDKLVPFVANEILSLLRQEDGTFAQSFCGMAVVVYADIRGFTSFSENNSPEEIASMLNQYFSIWQEATERHGGFIERFVGDAVQIVFFQNRNSDYIQDALETAIAVQRRVKDRMPIRCGIGLAHSEIRFVMAGDPTVRRHLLAVGEAVLKAQVLEQLSKQGIHTQILVDKTVSSRLAHLFDFESLPDNENYELSRY